jgi:hypothetical protein
MSLVEFQRRTFVCTWTETPHPSTTVSRSTDFVSAALHYRPLERDRSEPPFTRATDRSPLGIARGRRCTKVVSDVTPRCFSIDLLLWKRGLQVVVRDNRHDDRAGWVTEELWFDSR